jgi:hypothetical protein
MKITALVAVALLHLIPAVLSAADESVLVMGKFVAGGPARSVATGTVRVLFKSSGEELSVRAAEVRCESSNRGTILVCSGDVVMVGKSGTIRAKELTLELGGGEGGGNVWVLNTDGVALDAKPGPVDVFPTPKPAAPTRP